MVTPLILGAHGFVGTNLQQIMPTAVAADRVYDLRDPAQAEAVVQRHKPRRIVNLAAHVGSVKYVSDFAADVIDDNMRIILNVYRAAMTLPDRPVIINTVASCGYPGDATLFEERHFWGGPVHESVLAFGSTRRMIDAVSTCYRRQHGLFSVNLLVPNLYGPHDHTDPQKTHALNALAVKFVRAMNEGHDTVEVWGTGKPVREWLYVKDLAAIVQKTLGMLAFCEPADFPSMFNVGQGVGVSIKEIVDALVEATGYDGEIIYNTDYPDGASTKIMSPATFRDLFPRFRFTSLADGINDTIAWLKGLS